MGCDGPHATAARERYVTKDSGERVAFESGMIRDTERGKPRFDLLLPLGIPYREQLLTRFADLMARGAEKYQARNWEQADSEDELARAKSSAFRHFVQWMAGESDEDHAAAVMFGLMAAEAIEWKMTKREVDELRQARPDIYDPEAWGLR